MTEDQEKTKRAKERDHFCVNLDKLVDALRLRKSKEIQLAIANAFNAYAGPENQEPDLVLAESLWNLDKTLIKMSTGSVDFFLELDKTKAPPWAFYFLEEILRGPPSINDMNRIAFIERLQDDYRDSVEVRFLYVISIVFGDESCCEQENDFKLVFGMLRQLAGGLPARQPITMMYRHSLREDDAHVLLNRYWILAIRRYVDFLIGLDRLDEALNFLDHQVPEKLHGNLVDFYSRVKSEKRSKDRVEQRFLDTLKKLEESAEQAQVKHIEILSLFVAIIAFVGGGLFSHLTASSEYKLGSLVEFGLMLIGIFSIGLGLVAKNRIQIVLRMGLGLISIALAVYLVFLLN